MRCLYAVPTSTPLGTMSPSLLIDLLPGVTALSLSISHPRSRLLKLTLPSKISYSLSPFPLPLRGPSWPYVSLCVRVAGSLSASLCWWFSGWENLSLSLDAIPAPQLQEISSIRTSSWELLTSEIRSLDLSVCFPNDPQAPLNNLLIDIQRPRLKAN